MQYLPDGTQYEDDPIDNSDDVSIGDEFVFISQYPDRYPKIQNRVVTVSDISNMGGIAVFESPLKTHFVRRCFHKIVVREDRMDDFDAVFT